MSEAEIGIELEDVAKTEAGYEVLGPAYFASRRIAERVMNGADVEPLKEVAAKASEMVRDSLYDYIETYIMGDLEVNFQGHLYRLVDDTVKALLTGEPWAIQRYALSQRFDGVQVREAIAKHAGDEVAQARIADLEKTVAELKETIRQDREWRR